MTQARPPGGSPRCGSSQRPVVRFPDLGHLGARPGQESALAHAAHRRPWCSGLPGGQANRIPTSVGYFFPGMGALLQPPVQAGSGGGRGTAVGAPAV